MYLLDSNVFIQAKNFYYGFDICPGFWQWMDREVSGNEVRSIVPVYEELANGGDELAEWIKARRDDGRFLDVTDPQTQVAYRRIALAVHNGSYHRPAKDHFLTGADPWLIAKAKVIDATVVTHEKAAVDAKRRVPLPNICSEFQVHFIDVFALLRSRDASFGLVA